MKNILETWNTERPAVLDGAWGTQMQAQGLPVGACGEGWNLRERDKVLKVARAYVEAGSDIILTNTFCGSRFMLERHGLAADTVAINRAGAEISREAAGNRAKVFGSIGPTGKMMMMGESSPEELEKVFSEQAQALAEGGADGLAVETMSDLEELRCAVRAAVATGLPVVACMVYDAGANHDRTMMGVSAEQHAETALAEGAAVAGANCGNGPERYVRVCEQLHRASGRPVWIKPNAGLPEMVDGNPVYSMTPEAFAAFVPRMREAGAGFIGGCCGTSPEFIARIRRVVSQ